MNTTKIAVKPKPVKKPPNWPYWLLGLMLLVLFQMYQALR